MPHLPTNLPLIIDDRLLLILVDEVLGEGLQGVETSVGEASDEVDLAEAADGEAFEEFVVGEGVVGGGVVSGVNGVVPEAGEIDGAIEDTALDGDSVVKQDVAVGGFEADGLGDLLDCDVGGVKLGEGGLVVVELTVEEVLQVAGLDV
jgi:hypothetical protein